MKFTCSSSPDSDKKYQIKANGINIGHIREETHANKETVWVWRTLAVAVHNNRSGACESFEAAKAELKASNPVLIER
jgi:hypothetical protein